MIFVAQSPDATFTVDEYLGGLGEHFASFGFETWHSVAAVHPHPIAANWRPTTSTSYTRRPRAPSSTATPASPTSTATTPS
jgi:hypothetical protein